MNKRSDGDCPLPSFPHSGRMNAPPNIRDLLQGHVTLQLQSLDRLYLNGYVAHLQHGAGLVRFLSQHRGNPIASPALLGHLTGQFVANVRHFARNHHIPLFPFRHQESKDQRAHQLRRQRAVRDAVVFIGVALGPSQLQSFLAKWQDRLPLPLSASDRAAGYDYKLSVRQLEVSLTQIMDRPVAGRQFFEEVIRDNLDLGRPDRVQLIFPRKIIRTTPGSFRTRILREGVHPSLHVSYKHFDLKQYYKEGRGLRTEGTFHDPGDFAVNKGIENLPSLKELGHQINQRLLEVERVSQNCGLSAGSIQRVLQPTVTKDGQRAPGLKFGDPRVMALMLVLCQFRSVIEGMRNRELRRQVASLLGVSVEQYSSGQASYDLRRLLRKGLLGRALNSQRYDVTPYGWKLARLYARLEARIFRPALTAMNGPPAAVPGKLTQTLSAVDSQFDELISQAFPARRAA